MARVQLLDDETGRRMRGSAGPDARRAFMHRPAMAHAIGEWNAAAFDSRLPLRLHEVVRYRVAQINGCVRCQAYRAPGGADAGATEALLAEVADWRTAEVFTPAERDALEFTERFCFTPEEVDDALTDALRGHLGDDGLVDLAMCVAKYVAVGRLITVLDLDQVCSLVPEPHPVV